LAGSLKTQRFNHTATLLPDGIPLIVGGTVDFNVGSLDSVELGNTFVSLPKITMASVAGKKLIVVGENFSQDAVILINSKHASTL